MQRYEPIVRYVGTGTYVAYAAEHPTGDYVAHADVARLESLLGQRPWIRRDPGLSPCCLVCQLRVLDGRVRRTAPHTDACPMKEIEAELGPAIPETT